MGCVLRESMTFSLIYDIYSYYITETFHLMPVKTWSCLQHSTQQPDAEAGQWIELNMQDERLQSVEVIKRVSGAASLEINWTLTLWTHAAFVSCGDSCQSGSRQPLGNVFWLIWSHEDALSKAFSTVWSFAISFSPLNTHAAVSFYSHSLDQSISFNWSEFIFLLLLFKMIR